jgi:hypothetical protein
LCKVMIRVKIIALHRRRKNFSVRAAKKFNFTAGKLTK